MFLCHQCDTHLNFRVLCEMSPTEKHFDLNQSHELNQALKTCLLAGCRSQSGESLDFLVKFTLGVWFLHLPGCHHLKNSLNINIPDAIATVLTLNVGWIGAKEDSRGPRNLNSIKCPSASAIRTGSGNIQYKSFPG